MCGRYRLSRRKQIIEEQFEAQPWDDDWSPRFNIAPTQQIPFIRQHPKEPIRQISTMRWGLVPSWAKDTAATKPAFRDPLRRRCLIPADGFYEWKRNGSSKQPYCFEMKNGELFAFAGLWDGWKDASGNWVKTCSILTTTPNLVTSTVHDRMPVILRKDDYDLWLDPGMQHVAAISELLQPYDAMLMRCFPVSTRVNHVANDDEDCSRPVEIVETQDRLFS